jgi:hypothetical protein
MVHALEEIRRTLVLGGFLIDLRPLTGREPVEVTTDRNHHEVGRLTNLPGDQADDEAANSAIKEAARRGWFVLESKQNFPFLYYWDTPGEMREYIQEKWSDFVLLEDDLFTAVKTAWTAAGAEGRVRVRMKMQLTRWRKQ